MTRYNRGRAREWKTISLLESLGYECVRAAGSHGVFDVWACSKTELLLVQVKSSTAKISPAEREQIRLFVAPANARKLVHTWTKRQMTPHVEELP